MGQIDADRDFRGLPFQPGAKDAYDPRCRKDFSAGPRPAASTAHPELLPFLRNQG